MKKTWKTTLFAVILATALLFQTPGTAYAEGTSPAGNRCFASAETDAGAEESLQFLLFLMTFLSPAFCRDFQLY